MNKNDEKSVIIHIKTERYGVRADLFNSMLAEAFSDGGARRHASGEAEEPELSELDEATELLMGIMADPSGESGEGGGYFVRPSGKGDVERTDMYSEGRLFDDGECYSLSYEESELTGLEGSTSTVTFRHTEPTLVNVLRSGAVSTAMTFKPHCRAICVYNTPYMPFEIGVHCITVNNRLLDEGLLLLDYIIEIRGGEAERCRMELRVREVSSDIAASVRAAAEPQSVEKNDV